MEQQGIDLQRQRPESLYLPCGSRLDARDLAILRALQVEARTTAQELTTMLQLSHSAACQRVRRLETSGAIRRHVAELDEGLFAGWSSFWITAKLTPLGRANLKTLEGAIRQSPYVLEGWESALLGELHLKIAAPSAQALENVRLDLDPTRRLLAACRIEAIGRCIKNASPHPLLLVGS